MGTSSVDEADALATSGKWLAWASIAIGLLTAMTPVLPGWLVQDGYSKAQLAWFVLLGTTGAAAGIEAFTRRTRGLYALLLVYAVQVVSYSSDGLSFDFMSPISLALGFGSRDPPRLLSVNLLALVACALALYNARRRSTPRS